MGAFIEDEALPRGTMAWTSDGRGIQWCSAAGRMYIPHTAEVEAGDGARVRLVDKIVRQRFASTGIRFERWRCQACGGWHLEREP
jgi:hypothetical protein